MLATISTVLADAAGDNASGPALRGLALLSILLLAAFLLFQHTTKSSKKLAAELERRKADPAAVPTAPLPVAFGDREPSIAEGAGLEQVVEVIPDFSPLEMLSIARETFSLVRKARSEHRGELADGLLNAALTVRLTEDLAADLREHRHHLYPMLDIGGTTIVASRIVEGTPSVDVRFALTGAEVERSDRTGEIVFGDEAPKRWDEQWTFVRPDVHGFQAQDTRMTHTAGGWMIPHRGWVVSAIAVGSSVPLPVPQPPTGVAQTGAAPDDGAVPSQHGLAEAGGPSERG